MVKKIEKIGVQRYFNEKLLPICLDILESIQAISINNELIISSTI